MGIYPTYIGAAEQSNLGDSSHCILVAKPR